MRTVEQLKARRAILVGALKRVRKGWTRYVLAIDRNNHRVLPIDRNTVCWCASGALIASGRLPDHPGDLMEDSYHKICVWNDKATRTQDDVIAAFEAAIQQTDDEIATATAAAKRGEA